MELLDRVNGDRIAKLTLELVKIPSPSGKEMQATVFFADILQNIGLEVSLDTTFPESPSIIAYLRSTKEGKTLQFDGHIDTVSIEHPPGEIRDGRVYGRGSADMKGNLAALAEAMRILVEEGLELPGDLLITIHGQHEDAVGENPLHAPLFSLFDKHIFGDAVIVCEGPHDGLVIAGKGLSFWEIDITRQGDPLHEVTSGGASNPLWAAYRILQSLENRASVWAQEPDPDVGPQSFFVGEIVGGDYYNRIPTHVHMKGTRRTTPGVNFESMQADFQLLVNQVARDMDLEISLKLIQSGQSYRLSSNEPIVRAVRDAYTSVNATTLPLIGLKYTGNASQFNNIASVPAVYFGADQSRAHATPEWIDIDKLVTAAQVYLLSAFNYFEYASGVYLCTDTYSEGL